MRTSEPSSVEGIEKYLGSGMIRGIGPVYARKLVRAFGEKVFDVIEAEPERLREVTGIGKVRAKRITDAWAEQKVVREIMVFLHSHGVGTARAVRIFRTYGADAVEVMTENPYRLARDIRGIGFVTADAIAMKLGIAKTAMVRVRAGIGYALTEVSTAEPVPNAAPPADLSSSSRDIGVLGFAVARLSRSNLLLGPGETPACMSFLDDVVAPAWQSPVADRWPYGDGLAIVFDTPLAAAQRQADFRAAAAGAQMLCQSVLYRYVEIAGLKRWRHVIDTDRGPRASLQAGESPFPSWRSRPVEAETSMVSMSCGRSFLYMPTVAFHSRTARAAPSMLSSAVCTIGHVLDDEVGAPQLQGVTRLGQGLEVGATIDR